MRPRPQLSRRILALELAVLACAVLYYEVGTYFFRADPALSHEHARHLWGLERAWGLDWEAAFQQFFNAMPIVLWVLIFFYVGPHFALTLGFLVWAYWYRFPRYPEVRDAFLSFTLLSFGFQWLYPLSPPRYIPEAGLEDSVDLFLPVSGETPWIQRLTNPYAALPSVHFGWALLVALLAIRLTASRWRYLWLLYPLAICLSIFATGNHWTLDVALSLVFIAGTESLLALRRRLPAARAAAARRPKPAAAPMGEAT